jgi:hypothetical protein
VADNLTMLMESIAYHRAEVQKQVQPELALFEDNHHV